MTCSATIPNVAGEPPAWGIPSADGGAELYLQADPSGLRSSTRLGFTDSSGTGHMSVTYAWNPAVTTADYDCWLLYKKALAAQVQIVVSSISSPPLANVSEVTGGVAHTWSNYSNAGGIQGPSMPAFATVQIGCKVQGFKVADGNTWWYRIAQDPWNGQYYVSADAFYNNGATSGSLHGTPFVDPNVPDCAATGPSPRSIEHILGEGVDPSRRSHFRELPQRIWTGTEYRCRPGRAGVVQGF